MIKTKKTFGIVSLIITFILLCGFVFVPFANKNQTKVGAEAVSNSIYAFVSHKESQVSDTKLYVDFGLSLDYNITGQETGEVNLADAKEMEKQKISPFEYATVYIRTRNLSAVAEAGDYEAVDQTIILYGTKPYASLSIKVHKDGLQINDSYAEKEGALRSFIVEIYKVEFEGLKSNELENYDYVPANTTPNVSSDILSVAAELSLTSTVDNAGVDQDGNKYNLAYLDNIGHYALALNAIDLCEITEDNYCNDIVVDLANVGDNMYAKMKYLSERNMLKLGIKIGGLGNEPGDVKINNAYVGVQVFAGNSTKAGLPDLPDVPSNFIFSDPSVEEIARWYIKFQSDAYEDLGLSNSFNGKFEGVSVQTYFDEEILISEKLSDGITYGASGRYDTYVKDGNADVIVIDDLGAGLNGGSVISTRMWMYLSGDRKTAARSILYQPINYRAKVVSATPSRVYYDAEGKARLGLSLRLSEPMQLRRYEGKVVKPTIDAYLNIVTDENKVTFDYINGEGTDTFYFETALPEMPITSLRLTSANEFDSIYDFAPYSTHAFGAFQNLSVIKKGSEKTVNGWDTVANSPLSCSFDLRKPKLALESKISSETKKSHSITVRTENISETGKLYYGWSTKQGEKPEQLSVVPISATESQMIPSPSGISGTRYLYAVAVSELDKRSEELTTVECHFDNEAPSVGEISVDDAYTLKKFSIPICNNSITGFENYASLKNSVQVVVSSDEDGENVILQEFVKIQGNENTLHTENVTFSFEISATEDLKMGTADNAIEFATYYVSFAFTDALENRTVIPPTAYYFDIRPIFKVKLVKEKEDPNFEMDEFVGNSLLGEDYYTLDLSKLDLYAKEGKTLYIKFQAINPTTDSGVDSEQPKPITGMKIVEFTNVVTGYDAISDFVQYSSDSIIKMTVKRKFAPGLYRLVLGDSAENSLRKTKPIYFYVTNGKVSDATGKVGLYQDVSYAINNLALTNKVYQIPVDVPYCYLTETGVLTTESYSGSNKPASFSSETAALSYIRYKEYLDLYAIKLDQTSANDLNGGFLRKAEGVTQVAKVGQIWIRYKDVNWQQNTTTTKWVYYYYAEDESALPINQNALSRELEIALNTVSNTIRSNLKTVYLVTEGSLDEYGAPCLSPEQIPAPASSLRSNSNTLFATAIEYSGDVNIYYPIEKNLPLATNVLVGRNENSRLYYKIENTNTYQPLTSGETFGECIQATGRVCILELGENGVLEYYVFVDEEEPVLTFTYETNDGVKTMDFNSSVEGQLRWNSKVYITGISDFDSLSFVAIYRYTSQGEGDLLKVYRKQDFDNGQGIRLEDGKYHVQVSDRSGNSYIFVWQIRSDELVATETTVGSSYIRFEMNRDEEELQYYKVYYKEDKSVEEYRLLTPDYNERRFTESGIYKFEIEDKYGNKYVTKVDENGNGYRFERILPTVDWRYKTDENNYLVYDPEKPQESKKLTVERVNDRTYKLFTSTYLHFLPLDGCAYEIISGTPQPNESLTSKWIALNQIVSFTMKVYYEADPNDYVVYSCIVDTTAPVVSVSYEKPVYEVMELAEIQQKFKNGDFKKEKNNFQPSFIGFTYDTADTFYVLNGERVQSRYFKVRVSDDYGVNNVKIYLNDEWINTEDTNISSTYLSRRGTYKIVAMDDYGNTSTFTFTNEYDDFLEYFVDGEKYSTDVAFIDYFNGTEYTKVEYGNSEMTIKLLSDSEIHYIVTDDKGNKNYFAFVVKDGAVYTFEYVIEIEEGEYGDPEIENISVYGSTALKMGAVAEMKALGVAIYLSKNDNGSFSLTVRSTNNEKKAYTVEVRVSSLERKNEAPYYFKTNVSTIPSFVSFVNEAGDAIPDSQTVKVNEAFTIQSAIAKEIESIEVAFSSTGNYTIYQTVYDGTYHQILFKDEGTYHVKVVNRYGIQTDYYVIISSQFAMSATIEHVDKTKIEYSINYTKSHQDFYSNKSVEFIVYSDNIIVYSNNIKVLDEHESIRVEVTTQGYTRIHVEEMGEYLLRIEDEYGNVVEKNIFIDAKTFALSEDTLIILNEKPLHNDKNYTNQEVQINKNNEIAFISMSYGNKTITLYDDVSEIKTAFDETQSIGTLGDGEYTLIFKDRYGNNAEKTVIHYCANPTLTIVRNTLNGTGEEVYSLEDMLEYGVWTNDSVSFSISATAYVLKVDGKENVKTIDYDTKTKNEYEVYYLDEYGFEYSFTVYLHREDVVITPTESMSISQVSDMLVTKDNVQMLFTEGAICSYVLNNEPEKNYNGEILYKDGVYRFKVTDLAGNVSTYTVKKDSAVEYRLEGTGAGEILLNGGVTNGHSVKFLAEKSDKAYIKKVFHNNEWIAYDDEIFTERGKWELIIADDVGNESYFRFYILYGKLDGFTYNVPYNYVINSVVWEMEDSIADASDTIKEQGLRLETTENGKYTVTMQSSVTGDRKTFTFTIDKTPPQVELLGCKPNQKTINNVTLKGCTVGDTVYVYKDGALVKTVRIDSDYMDPPTISEAGKYTIVVKNEANVQTALSFERKYIPNTAGSILIIVLSLVSVAVFFVGLIWRNHSKTDD